MAEHSGPTGERYDLGRLTPSSMVLCGSGIRRSAAGAETLETAAGAIIEYLQASLWDSASDQPASVLIRLYRTVSFARLEPDLQRFARLALESRKPWPEMRCLTLMATAGVRPEWNSRHESTAHRAIPLPSAEAVARLPMVSRLVSQLGVDAKDLVGPGREAIIENEGRPSTNVFHVADAVGSRFVPAQEEFVKPMNVRSVVGFGGQLGVGDLYAVIVFSRVLVNRATADILGFLGSDVRMAIVPTLARPLFKSEVAERPPLSKRVLRVRG